MILNLAKKGYDAKGMYSIHSLHAKKLWDSMKIGTIKDSIVCSIYTFSDSWTILQEFIINILVVTLS